MKEKRNAVSSGIDDQDMGSDAQQPEKKKVTPRTKTVKDLKAAGVKPFGNVAKMTKKRSK